MMEKNVSKAIIDVSNSLGINPDDLYRLINFESGWNPQAKNPNSSARGLIQFTDKTAQSLGYLDSLDLVNKNKSIESQLYFPVLQYLSKFKPFPTKQSLYMSVFYPVARYWPENKQFPDKVKNANPGIVTVADYIRKIERKTVAGLSGGLLSLMVLGLLFFFSKGFRA